MRFVHFPHHEYIDPSLVVMEGIIGIYSASRLVFYLVTTLYIQTLYEDTKYL
jgi:hypothetical protein